MKRTKWRNCSRAAKLIVTMALLSTVLFHPNAPRAQAATFDGDPAAYLQAIREINYSPPDASWSNMWSSWDSARIAQDYASIAALGANTVRVIVQMGAFGYPNPRPDMVAHLDELLAIAASNGLRVHLTLFDGWGNYDQIAGSTTFVNSLIPRYRNDPRLAIIELQNEIKPSDARAMTWARTMLPILKAAAGATPLALSVSGRDGLAGLTSLKAQTADSPLDFLSFHYYGGAGSAYATLAEAKRLAGATPLFVGEVGSSTYSLQTAGSDPVLESQQALLFSSVNAATSSLGLASAAPWTLYDLNANGIPANISSGGIPMSLAPEQHYYGVLRRDGSLKPAATQLSKFWNGAPSTAILNTGFETVSDGIPTGWIPREPTGASRLAVDNTQSQTGSSSVVISGTSGADPNSWPRYQTVVNTGAIVTGQRLQATVWAKGSNATGENLISIGWFDATNKYLGNSLSSKLPPGGSNWIQLGVNATAPAGAAYAQLALQSRSNTGTVWFDNVTIVALDPLG